MKRGILLLTRDGVVARYIFAFCFFLLSGAQIVTGWLATVSGVLGTIELATALLWFSPLYAIKDHLKSKSTPQILPKKDMHS